MFKVGDDKDVAYLDERNSIVIVGFATWNEASFVDEGIISLNRAIELMTSGPARVISHQSSHMYILTETRLKTDQACSSSS